MSLGRNRPRHRRLLKFLGPTSIVQSSRRTCGSQVQQSTLDGNPDDDANARPSRAVTASCASQAISHVPIVETGCDKQNAAATLFRIAAAERSLYLIVVRPRRAVSPSPDTRTARRRSLLEATTCRTPKHHLAWGSFLWPPSGLFRHV